MPNKSLRILNHAGGCTTMHDETSPIVLGKVQITEIIAVGIKLGGEFEVCDAIYLTNALVEISIWMCVMHSFVL